MNHRILVLVVFALSFLNGCGEDNSTNPIDIKNGTVKIGTQVWMLKNLDVDHYRNGDSIPEVRDSLLWKNLTSGAWCYYNNDPANGAVYGKLYNWYAVNDPRGIAPSGWHVPSFQEWDILTKYLGGKAGCGAKLKEQGILHWNSPNEGSTNSSGFSALPGGKRINDWEEYYIFGSLGYFGSWWTSNDNGEERTYIRFLSYSDSLFFHNFGDLEDGYSVRCIKD